jgi:hypothetical protein
MKTGKTGAVNTQGKTWRGANTGMQSNPAGGTKTMDAGTKTMSGVRGGSSKKGGRKASMNTQGDKQGGQTAGRSRTNKGRNRIGASRQQAFT